MKMNLAKLTCFALVAAALVAVPSLGRAEDSTNAPAAQAPAPKKSSLPYHGKVSAINTNAMTFTFGATTLGITSETKITKNGKPAIFEDLAVGDNVSGHRKTVDGKEVATTVRIGAPKKKEASDSAPAAAPAPDSTSK